MFLHSAEQITVLKKTAVITSLSAKNGFERRILEYPKKKAVLRAQRRLTAITLPAGCRSTCRLSPAHTPPLCERPWSQVAGALEQVEALAGFRTGRTLKPVPL